MPEHIQEIVALAIVALAAGSILWRFLGVCWSLRRRSTRRAEPICPHGCECGPAPHPPPHEAGERQGTPGWTEPARVH